MDLRIRFAKSLKSRTKGTMILHYKGLFLKVVTARSGGGNDWVLDA